MTWVTFWLYLCGIPVSFEYMRREQRFGRVSCWSFSLFWPFWMTLGFVQAMVVGPIYDLLRKLTNR